MIIEINGSQNINKTNCELDGTKCNSNQWWNNHKCQCDCKKSPVCEKDYVWNSAACNQEDEKYLASIVDDSVIKCDEIISVNEANFIEKKTYLVKHKISIF